MQLFQSLCVALSAAAIFVDAAPSPEAAAQTVLDGMYSMGNATDCVSDDIESCASFLAEEYWFRFEAADVVDKATILELASRAGQKNYDDQAYKWISTDASKVTRQRDGRVPAIYVLNSGARARIVAAAKDFDEQVAKQEPTAYVRKENEHDDVGINGVAKANGKTPLELFRAEVKRSVFKIRNEGSSRYLTWTGSTKTNGATDGDQARLNKFWS